jgi:hypothetical protein
MAKCAAHTLVTRVVNELFYPKFFGNFHCSVSAAIINEQVLDLIDSGD